MAILQEREIADALLDLDIDANAKRTIGACIRDLREAIDIEREREHERAPEARRAQKKYLSSVSKQIDRLWGLIQSSDSLNIGLFNKLTSERIGRFLSNSSFEQIGAPRSSLEPTDGDLGFRPPMRDSDYDWREQAAIRNRQLFAERHGNSALGVTLLRVKERLDRQYELMSANKGGAPGKAYRGLAIRSLVKAFEPATRKPATGTAGGLFVKVCAAAFPLLGIDDKGLENAIDRELQKLSKNPARRNPA